MTEEFETIREEDPEVKKGRIAKAFRAALEFETLCLVLSQQLENFIYEKIVTSDQVKVSLKYCVEGTSNNFMLVKYTGTYVDIYDIMLSTYESAIAYLQKEFPNTHPTPQEL